MCCYKINYLYRENVTSLKYDVFVGEVLINFSDGLTGKLKLWCLSNTTLCIQFYYSNGF